MLPGQAEEHERAGERCRPLLERMAAGLNLTPAQREKAKTIFQQSRQDTEAIREQMWKTREDLWAAVKANDPAKIQQLSAQEGQIHGQLLTKRAETRAKFVALLTPEQRTTFENRASRMMKSMQARHCPMS